LLTRNSYNYADLRHGAPSNETHSPWCQGLNSSIFGEGNPLNILIAIPMVAYGYTPLPGFNLWTWTNYRIVNRIRTRS
jgi:hypothetical protein